MGDRAGRVGRSRGSQLLVLGSVALAVALSLLGPPGRLVLSSPGRATARTALPDVVLVMTDDQRLETLAGMPRTRRLLVDRGTWFRRAMVPTPLCCPSRVSMLTGLFAHDTGVWGNGDVGGTAIGGWPRFRHTGGERHTLASALAARGYRTALIGKYLNYFGSHARAGYRPPGWDVFAAMMSDHGSYYRYRLSGGRWHGTRPADYSTDVLRRRAVSVVRSTPRHRPLLLYLAPFAPHFPYLPAPRHVGVLGGRPVAFGAVPPTEDLTRKPAWLRDRPSYTAPQVAAVREGQEESLLAVDEAVGAVARALARTGRLRTTLFVFTSDNGYLWGEHTHVGKDAPYRQALSVPLVLRWDGHVPPGAVDDRLALNVDVTATIVRAAGARLTTDGLDLVGSARRRGFVVEATDGYGGRPAYCGWRTARWLYVRYGTGEEELYDYRRDPGETTNLAGTPGRSSVLRRWRRAAESACRPTPPGFRW